MDTVTIFDSDWYRVQLPCVKDAFDNLAPYIGCPNLQNQCYCMDEVSATAFNYLSEQVRSGCGKSWSSLVNSAVVVYVYYCNEVMATASYDSLTSTNIALATTTPPLSVIATPPLSVTATPLAPQNSIYTSRYTGPTFSQGVNEHSGFGGHGIVFTFLCASIALLILSVALWKCWIVLKNWGCTKTSRLPLTGGLFLPNARHAQMKNRKHVS